MLAPLLRSLSRRPWRRLLVAWWHIPNGCFSIGTDLGVARLRHTPVLRPPSHPCVVIPDRAVAMRALWCAPVTKTMPSHPFLDLGKLGEQSFHSLFHFSPGVSFHVRPSAAVVAELAPRTALTWGLLMVWRAVAPRGTWNRGLGFGSGPAAPPGVPSMGMLPASRRGAPSETWSGRLVLVLGSGPAASQAVPSAGMLLVLRRRTPSVARREGRYTGGRRLLLQRPVAFSWVATYSLVAGHVCIHGVMGPISSAVATACDTHAVVGRGGAGVNPLCKLPCGRG
jgi:hypothetical protein